MTRATLLLITAAAVLTGCDRIKERVARLAKPAETAAAAPSPAGPSAGSFVRDISESEFDSFTSQKGKLVVVDFHASWCGPCRKLAPILDKLATEQGGLVVVGKIDVDQAESLASREGIRSIPDVRLYRDGRRVDQFVGVPGESAIREKFTRHTRGLELVEPEKPATAEEVPATPAPLVEPMKKDWLPPGMQRR